MVSMISWLVVVLLVGAAFNPIVKVGIFLVALGITVVAEKCRKEMESGSHWH